MGHPLEKSRLSFSEKVFTIIWMNEINSRLGSPLVDVDTEVIERCAVGVEWTSIRSKYTEVLWSEV